MIVTADPLVGMRGSSGLVTFADGLLLAAITWGAFAFGGVYPWAFWPLAIAAQVAGLIGIFARGGSRRADLAWLAASLALFVAFATLQLLPLPLDVVRQVSPAAGDLLKQLSPAVALGLEQKHPLSIMPGRTMTGIAMVASFALLVFGGARLMSVRGARVVAEGIAIIGTAIALFGIIQHPLFNGKIYGFWTLRGDVPYTPYGPFINKNHFAGWMLMGLPLTIGLLCGQLARQVPHAKQGIRERILWLSSPAASQLLLLTAAAAVMALSLVLTMSRSGIAAGGLTAVALIVLSVRKMDTRATKAAAAAIISVAVLLVITWVGAGTIAARFSEANWRQINNRKGPWIDAVDIARRYPLVGTGLNTYGVATLFYQRHDLSYHYAEAHNDYLQLAAEGGALLALPAILCGAFFVAAVRRRFREEPSTTTYCIRAGAVIGLCGIAVQETVEFSLQMPGNAFLFAVLCAVALHRTPERGPSPVRPSAAAGSTRWKHP